MGDTDAESVTSAVLICVSKMCLNRLVVIIDARCLNVVETESRCNLSGCLLRFGDANTKEYRMAKKKGLYDNVNGKAQAY